ncbi:hypothetical protein [Mycobacterium vicinigordonae]|uniref:Bacterial Pleckstrin homology domain-containing protein n=1 Tax=Mycobacterium vicinigordonae TaxID=1719132 RepID=A0A7D6IA46_9MYCO|nr:hypothetical protein [Mycobacterium vicinigordonae]QLL08477.1 hypothetical protein H0P51_05935 [Mycobacterium vicinigordonae]
MTALYEDSGLTLDEDGMTIRRYYFPFANAKRIEYADITSIKSKKMGWATGKGRIWGATDPRYWFPLDVHRGRKSTLLILHTGRPVRACITPDDPAAVIKILRAKVKI